MCLPIRLFCNVQIFLLLLNFRIWPCKMAAALGLAIWHVFEIQAHKLREVQFHIWQPLCRLCTILQCRGFFNGLFARWSFPQLKTSIQNVHVNHQQNDCRRHCWWLCPIYTNCQGNSDLK